MRCYNCQKMGHFSKECRNKKFVGEQSHVYEAEEDVEETIA